MEQPGYAQMRKLIQFQQYQFEPLFVREKLGFDVEAVTTSDADALYITPSNQYPMAPHSIPSKEERSSTGQLSNHVGSSRTIMTANSSLLIAPIPAYKG